tara:strand:+ start:410 stop:1462 length:1053 start_codon:yes stop_codon:yes gene_type:complete
MQVDKFLPTPSTDMGLCKQQLSNGSRSFYFASHLLPSVMQHAACGLYAFCREADDLVDEGDDPTSALETLHYRLDRIYEGKPQYVATDRVLTQIVHTYQMPRELLNALLEGFAWDAEGKLYHSIEDVYDYSARVAGAVGVMMSVLMGVRDARTLARAADLGTAMQLTNIARDVGEDARLGRVYLPMDELKAEGVDTAKLLGNPTYTDGVGVVTKRLLERAEWLYKRADHGIAQLPRKYQPGIRAARKLYAAIGEKVGEHGYNSVDQRAIVETRRKFTLLASAVAFAQPWSEALDTPALPQNQFLIDAVVASGSVVPAITTDPFKVRTLWIIDLFETLRERDRDARIARIR